MDIWSLIFACGSPVSQIVRSGNTVNVEILSPNEHLIFAFEHTYESAIIPLVSNQLVFTCEAFISMRLEALIARSCEAFM